MRLCAVKLLSFGNICPFQLMPLPTLHTTVLVCLVIALLLAHLPTAGIVDRSGTPALRMKEMAVYDRSRIQV